MTIYFIILILLLANGLLAKGNRKYYVISSFLVLIIVASLRDFTIGKDLMGHYAKNYATISHLNWGNLVLFTGSGRYDMGFVVLCRVLGYISGDPQFFIFATSLIIFGLVGRYIFWQSDDPVLETVLFYCLFLYFMYYTMIAQAIAISIVMFSLEFLSKKKYIWFIFWVIVAFSIHSSAIVCLAFIPLDRMQGKRKYIFTFLVGLILFILLFDRILGVAVNTIFSDYSFHLAEGNHEGIGYGFSYFGIGKLLFYFMGIILVVTYAYSKKNSDVSEKIHSLKMRRRQYSEVETLSTNFLLYMTLSAIAFSVLATRLAIVNRMGYYTYFFAGSLIVRSLSYVPAKDKRLFKLFVYAIAVLYFILFAYSAGTQSYGIVPYKFFWK